MQPVKPPLGPVEARWLRDLAPQLLVGAVGVFLWGIVAWLTFVSVPRGERLFTEFHMAIPIATELILRFAFLAVPAVAVTTLILCALVRRRLAWLWFAVLLPLILGAGIFISLYVPIAKLLRGLTGTTAGWWNHF